MVDSRPPAQPPDWYRPPTEDALRPVLGALRASSAAAGGLDGQQRARIKRVCDNLVDSEDELLYLVEVAPELKPVVDQVVALIVQLTPIAYPPRVIELRIGLAGPNTDIEGEDHAE